MAAAKAALIDHDVSKTFYVGKVLVGDMDRPQELQVPEDEGQKTGSFEQGGTTARLHNSADTCGMMILTEFAVMNPGLYCKQNWNSHPDIQ